MDMTKHDSAEVYDYPMCIKLMSTYPGILGRMRYQNSLGFPAKYCK